MSFPKSMIIGLGGIGSRIVCDVYKQFKNADPSPAEKRIVSFLCFDTDAGDVEQMRCILPRENVVKTSSDESQKISAYIMQIRNRTNVNEWFDIDSPILMDMKISTGAGQIRMASRLALLSSIERGEMDIIVTELNRILTISAETARGNEIGIHIVCSLAGGTGAGSFLQMAYFIKDLMINQFRIQAPQVTGYFILADILSIDRQAGFTEDQIENTFANTYACIKELNGIITLNRNNAFKVELEYRLNMRDTILPNNYLPYDLCYMYGYQDNLGQNIGEKENYYRQVEDNIFFNVFSPVGDHTRSADINNILRNITRNGVNRYASTGVASIVYPYEDIIEYFSLRRMMSNLEESWNKIDNVYRQARKEYNRQKAAGLNPEEPKRDRFFMTQLEFYRDDEAFQIFRMAYKETRIIDKNGRSVKAKAQVFYDEVLEYLKSCIENYSEYKSIKDSLEDMSSDFVERSRYRDDLDDIQSTESKLQALKEKAVQLIDEMRLSAYKEIVCEDKEIQSRNLNRPQRLNFYILRMGEEMHPLAVRYFLYEWNRKLTERIQELENANKTLYKDIVDYSKAYDNEDTEDVIESAEQVASELQKRDSSPSPVRIIRRLISGSNEYMEFKEDYVSKSKAQKQKICEYTLSKLEEEVLKKVKIKTDLLIEQYERIFDMLPDTCKSLDKKAGIFANKHIGHTNRSIQYVLAKPELKEKLYEECIGDMLADEFPKDLCRAVYINVYDRVIDMREGALLEIFKVNDIFVDPVLESQKKSIRVSLRERLDVDVLSAIGIEARLEDKNTPEQIENLVKEYLTNSNNLASPMGVKGISSDARPINAWAFHPDVKNSGTLTPAKLTELLNMAQGAIIDNKFFNKYTILRANAYFTLEVPQNFPEFHSGSTEMNIPEGYYYKYYKTRLDKVLNPPRGMAHSVSPHLDKRWHGSGYFPNIGEDRELVHQKIYKAFFFGLVYKYFYLEIDGLVRKWQYKDSARIYRELKDADDRPVNSNLMGLMEGLLANPHVVDHILHDIGEKLLVEMRQYRSMPNTKTLLAGISPLQTIIKFKSKDFPTLNNNNLFLGITEMVKDYYDSEKCDAFFSTITKSLIENVLVIARKDANTREGLRTIMMPFTSELNDRLLDIWTDQLSTIS